MAFEHDSNFSYEVDPSLDEVVDESNNSMVVLRKAKWGDTDKSKFKIELRRCYVTNTGEERVGRGCTFITENGPNNLTSALLKHGFGDTKEVIQSIKDRDNFDISMRRALSDEDLERIKNTQIPESMLEPDYYDPKSMFSEDDDYVTVEDNEEDD
jgi:hypothetical protein